MTELELKAPYWKSRSEELFLSEHDDTDKGRKEFYTKYAEPTNLYYELASRVITDSGMAAYSLMYKSYMEDVRNNNFDKLEKLAKDYQDGSEG